ncbi:MAG: hypothetical protein AB1479_07160 [Pseudomonadota bacterium]
MRRILPLLLILPALSLGGLTLSLPARADRIEIIELQNRPAEDIIPLILPILRGDEAISGQGSQLILRASPETIGQVQRMLDNLDRAPRTLIISVRASAQDLRTRENAQTTMQVSPQGIAIQGGAGAREDHTGRDDTQRIRVAEGQPARLRVGEDTAITEPSVIPYPGGVAVVPSTRIQSTGRWLSVTPRLQGQQVMLDITPHEARVDPRHPRTLDVQHINTQILAPLGQWVPLGGVDTTETRTSGWNASTRERTNQIWVKVELGD